MYDISTRPEMQRKRYGSAMFYTALKFAKNKDVKYVVLQASPNALIYIKNLDLKKFVNLMFGIIKIGYKNFNRSLHEVFSTKVILFFISFFYIQASSCK
ncbi:MAG: hypothetical protein ACR5KV_00310 [Wolbachia sp.]